MPAVPRKASAMTDVALFKPTGAQVIAAVKSLCVDQLKPMGRLILKRIREQAAEAEAKARGVAEVDIDEIPRIDPKQLRRLCERCKELCVVPDDDKEYAALLAGRNLLFVDATNPVDQYSAEVWEELETHILDPGYKSLPASRYDCSRVLKSRNLPCLEGYSLGSVCHIIQLAISVRHIIGYKDGHLVPYHECQQRMKEVCASKQEVYGLNDQVLKVVSSWEELRVNLRRLLKEEGGPVMLSTVKRLFKTRFYLDLSETVLGQSRMVELLQDPRMHDVCVVQGHTSGQLIVRLACPNAPAAPPGYFAPPAVMAAPPSYVAPPPGNNMRPPAPPPQALCLSTTPTQAARPQGVFLPQLEEPQVEQLCWEAAQAEPCWEGCWGLAEAQPELCWESFQLKENWESASVDTMPTQSLLSWSLEGAWAQHAVLQEVEEEEPYLVRKQLAESECSEVPSTMAESTRSTSFDEVASVTASVGTPGTPVKNTFIQFPTEEAAGMCRFGGNARRRTQSDRPRVQTAC